MEVKNFIKIYDNCLSPILISKLISAINTFKFNEATIDKGETNFEIRKTFTKSLNNLSSSMTEVHWHNLLCTIFTSALHRYGLDTKTQPFNFTNIINIDVLKYENSGFYTWHTDHFADCPRTMSCILLLNNDYEGGELCFRDVDGTNEWCVKKELGRIIVWPSNFMFPHTVKPVVGKRLSIVAWSL
jgi:hypothetical protein